MAASCGGYPFIDPNARPSPYEHDLTAAPQACDVPFPNADVERIAQRVVELLKAGKP